MLITAGERKAMALLCMALHGAGVPAESFTGSQAGFVTDTNHMNARIVEVRPDRIRAALDEGKVPVVGGAQGVSTAKDVTFLGRGGSDTTAVALAHALGADACELYTDVSGVFTADPRLVPRARRICRISFDELLEMCACGCPKPAMRSVEFARTWHVPLHVRSASPGNRAPGWRRRIPPWSRPSSRPSCTTSSEAKVTIAGVPDEPGIAASVFRALADRDVNVDMIVQNVSEHGVTDISFTAPRDDLDAARDVTDDARRRDRRHRRDDRRVDRPRVSLVGAGMKSNPGVAATMFETLAGAGINIEMISTSAIRISCVVAEPDVERAVQALHTAFGLDSTPE